jgi:hypothetical protein
MPRPSDETSSPAPPRSTLDELRAEARQAAAEEVGAANTERADVADWRDFAAGTWARRLSSIAFYHRAACFSSSPKGRTPCAAPVLSIRSYPVVEQRIQPSFRAGSGRRRTYRARDLVVRLAEASQASQSSASVLRGPR